VVFLFPQTDEEQLARFYHIAYYGRDRRKFVGPFEAAVAARNSLKWRTLRPLLRPGDRMLDVGCGRGTMVRLARASGVEAYGIERPAPGETPRPWVFYKDLAECAFPDGQFQLVILWHVLEHLQDPRQTLREVHRILKPGGWLSLAVPNFGGAQARASGSDWFHLDLPRHLWHFRRQSLQALIEGAGFRMARCTTLSVEYDWFGTLQSWMNRALEDDNGLYSLLKREKPQPLVESLRRLAAAAGLALPALLSVLWDAARGEGGTLTVAARK
jgi:SAM-dependent methyltransferase